MNETEFNLIKNNDWSNLDGRNTRATGRLVQEFIKLGFSDCELSIENNTNEINSAKENIQTINGSVTEVGNRVTTLNNKVNTINNNITNIDNRVNTINNNIKTYTIKIGTSASNTEPYTQTHNIFRITRPENTVSWGILNNPLLNLELRLGPFNELIKIGEDIIEDNNHYIDLKDVVDIEEEIIIKILSNE